jgi:hypothetical protein
VIAVEQEYLESLRMQQEKMRMLKNQVEALMREYGTKGDANDAGMYVYVCLYAC